MKLRPDNRLYIFFGIVAGYIVLIVANSWFLGVAFYRGSWLLYVHVAVSLGLVAAGLWLVTKGVNKFWPESDR